MNCLSFHLNIFPMKIPLLGAAQFSGPAMLLAQIGFWPEYPFALSGISLYYGGRFGPDARFHSTAAAVMEDA